MSGMSAKSTDKGFVKWYIQHSKKLSAASLIQWAVVAIASYVLVLIGDVGEESTSLLEKVVQWSATIAVASVGGYMLNSAVEKACRQKLENIVGATEDTDEEDESGEG